LDPAPDPVAQSQPQARNRVRRLEIDVDDILIFFRRGFRITARAVRAPGEPAWMLLEPRVVLRTLNGEVQGDLQAMLGSSGNQIAEVLTRTQLRVNGIVTTLLAADGIRAARIVWSGGQ